MEEGKEAKQRNFENFKQFFRTNMQIKQSLINVYPKDQDLYGAEARGRYLDRLYRELRDFESDFMRIAKDFAPHTIPILQVHFQEAKEAFEVSEPDPFIIRRIFEKRFWNIETKLRDEINRTCMGYDDSVGPNLTRLIRKSTSVNEILHLFHAYLVNNDTILKSMPVIARDNRNPAGVYILYGEENDIARGIFEGLPAQDDSIKDVDIVAMKERIIMMVQGKGHALTIDIDAPENETAIVHYFIPKIVNRARVKRLPGSKNMQEDYVKGTFDLEDGRIAEDILDLIDRVPGDTDIPKREKTTFGVEELHEMAVAPASQNGRRIGRMEALQNAIKGAKTKLQSVLEGNGGEKDEPTDHDK